MAILNRDLYRCSNCNFKSAFEVNATEHICPYCNCNEMKKTYSNGSWKEEDLKKLLEDSNKFANTPVIHIGKVKPTITCPYCKSKNTSKIGVVGRGMSFGLFGFASSKVGKQWHCNHCKSDF